MIGNAIVGESGAIRHLRALIATAAPTRLPVLVEGPTGSGKELVAAALHEASGRRGRLVAFNVCAIGDSLFEDALFGHVRGAFTGAASDALGFLREADAGTVFLDEISGLPWALQAKLLRAVETGEFRPVGASRDARSDFRVVAATNERLDVLVSERRFRADLAHRIGAVVLQVPPLVERVEDLPLLVSHFLAGTGAAHLALAPEALAALQDHDWPGNVRELKQVVEWTAVLTDTHDGRCITADSVRTALAQRARARAAAIETPLVARRLLQLTLEHHGWNTVNAARALGIHRATLYRRMKRLRLSLPGS